MQVRVYYEDTDFSGVVYHANYLRFMERGRTNYLRLLGVDQRGLFEETEKEAPGFAFVVRSMTLDFLKPARMDDVLVIVTEPEEVKGASITLKQTVTRGDELLVEAHVRVAFVSGGRARPIPKPLRLAMKADQQPRVRGLSPGRIVLARSILGHLAVARHRRPAASCKSSSHELVQTGAPRLSPRQSERGADARRARADRREGAGRLHLRRGGALGRRQPGRALPAFPRSRRTAGECGAARLRAVRGGAGARLGRRRPDAFTAFERLGKAYLDFARAEPAYYSAMFEAGIAARHQSRAARGRRPRLRGAARRRPKRLIASLPAEGRPPALMMALHIWALSHGIASLFGRGDAARRTLPMSPEELLEAGVLVYLRGLGFSRVRPAATAARPGVIFHDAPLTASGIRAYICKCYLHSH